MRISCFPALILLLAGSLSAQQTPVSIHVHAAQPAGPYTPIWNYFGADEPNYISAPNGEKLLGELSALSPVPTTSMSDSKLSSFLRLSRVEGTASTMTTRMACFSAVSGSA